MTTPTTVEVPLPEPANLPSQGFGQLWRPLFTDDQLRAYAEQVSTARLAAAEAEIARLRAERSFDSLGMVLTHDNGRRSEPNIPGQPHRWAEAIAAWGAGRLVQWRYASPEATDADWQNCSYASQGEPNWWHAALEYRAALSPAQQKDGGAG